MTKIVFLDASTIEDSNLTSIADLGTFTKFATTTQSQVIERCQETDIVITNKVNLDAAVLKQLPQLKLICIAATGTNCIDLQTAEQLGITVKNVAGYSTPSVCQHTIGMIINLASNIHHYNRDIATWPNAPIFTQLHYPISDLEGKTLGVIGYGSIGQAVANIARAFGMKIIALARTPSDDPMRKGKEEFFATADYVSLHCPLTPETKEIINRDSLNIMKSQAFVINTGRGDLINETDLLKALQLGQIAGAALDVLTEEPPSQNHPLLNVDLDNLIITPHTAWASTESRARLIEGITTNIRNYLAE